MKTGIKGLMWAIATLLTLAGTVWLASGDRLLHHPSNRILNQSAIQSIRTVGPVSAGFELRQRIDTTKINDSHPELHRLPLCIHVFLDATDGTYFPGTLRFELTAGQKNTVATLHSSQIPNTFKRVCFPQSSMGMLIGAPEAELQISVLEPGARNVARIVLTPAATGDTPAEIDGKTSDLFLPHMVEVQRPPGKMTWLRTVAMLVFATIALFIIFVGSASARRSSDLSQASGQ